MSAITSIGVPSLFDVSGSHFDDLGMGGEYGEEKDRQEEKTWRNCGMVGMRVLYVWPYLHRNQLY